MNTYLPQPVSDRVIIIPEPKKETTDAGLILTNPAPEKFIKGVVHDTGNAVESVQKGDTVLIPNVANRFTEIEVEGQRMILIPETNIEMIL